MPLEYAEYQDPSTYTFAISDLKLKQSMKQIGTNKKIALLSMVELHVREKQPRQPNRTAHKKTSVDLNSNNFQDSPPWLFMFFT